MVVTPIQKIIERNKDRRIEPGEARMNLTPMIDVVFLLIIFFMLVTELSKIEVESVTLPLAAHGVPEVSIPPNRVIVNVLAASSTNRYHGSIWVQGRRMSPEGLRAILQRGSIGLRDREGYSELAVKVRADASIEWRYVQNVVLACQKVGVYRCAFGVAPPDGLNY